MANQKRSSSLCAAMVALVSLRGIASLRPEADATVTVATAGRSMNAFVAQVKDPSNIASQYMWTPDGEEWAEDFFESDDPSKAPKAGTKVTPEQAQKLAEKLDKELTEEDIDQGVSQGYLMKMPAGGELPEAQEKQVQENRHADEHAESLPTAPHSRSSDAGLKTPSAATAHATAATKKTASERSPAQKSQSKAETKALTKAEHKVNHKANAKTGGHQHKAMAHQKAEAHASGKGQNHKHLSNHEITMKLKEMRTEAKKQEYARGGMVNSDSSERNGFESSS